MSLTAPTQRRDVRGTVTVTANATDNVASRARRLLRRIDADRQRRRPLPSQSTGRPRRRPAHTDRHRVRRRRSQQQRRAHGRRRQHGPDRGGRRTDGGRRVGNDHDHRRQLRPHTGKRRGIGAVPRRRLRRRHRHHRAVSGHVEQRIRRTARTRSLHVPPTPSGTLRRRSAVQVNVSNVTPTVVLSHHQAHGNRANRLVLVDLVGRRQRRRPERSAVAGATLPSPCPAEPPRRARVPRRPPVRVRRRTRR